ncbi:5653_t:CDS:1 [Acaulospora colombiana]|uniref:5653_t:CDS:1 n=1 Tax=Acaulospora colombiana TaxID=27376 RepID=A0ACA9P2B5_9GLOM|nr:5653_t:CDS:1 [Acaulospora colombiana]
MDATQQQIKRAYHLALLRYHPDKNIPASTDQKLVNSSTSPPLEVHTLRQAFEILSNPDSRQVYDEQLRYSTLSSNTGSKEGPRPAHIVSLDDFEQRDGPEGSSEPTQWAYPCRCGGSFIITENLLESDVHLISCDACSEALWVGYEVQDEP